MADNGSNQGNVKQDQEISRTKEVLAQPEFPAEVLSTKEIMKNCASKILVTATTITALGVTRSYIRGERVALPFYIFACTSLPGAAIFFSGTAALKQFRKNEDALNYAVPGLVLGLGSGMIIGGSQYLRKGLIYGAYGAAGSAALYYLSNWFFGYSRTVYIGYRKQVENTSQYRRPIFVPHKQIIDRANVTTYDLNEILGIPKYSQTTGKKPLFPPDFGAMFRAVGFPVERGTNEYYEQVDFSGTTLTDDEIKQKIDAQRMHRIVNQEREALRKEMREKQDSENENKK